MRLELGGEQLVLLEGRAVCWSRRRILVVSDLHLGKAAAFRHHGIAVPEGSVADDLRRLSGLLEACGAGWLVITGDLFHAPEGHRPAVFDLIGAWRRRHAGLRVTLVSGNHDRALHRLPAEWGLEVRPEGLLEEGLLFVHHPPAPAGLPEEVRAVLCGHLHPALRLTGAGRALRAPCFWLQQERVLVLPGFGSFTGSSLIAPREGDRIFCWDERGAREVPSRLWLKGAKKAPRPGRDTAPGV